MGTERRGVAGCGQAAGEVFPEDVQGTPSEKFKPVEMERRFQLTSETVIKKGDDRDKILDETENTLRWGAGGKTERGRG